MIQRNQNNSNHIFLLYFCFRFAVNLVVFVIQVKCFDKNQSAKLFVTKFRVNIHQNWILNLLRLFLFPQAQKEYWFNIDEWMIFFWHCTISVDNTIKETRERDGKKWIDVLFLYRTSRNKCVRIWSYIVSLDEKTKRIQINRAFDRIKKKSKSLFEL